MNNERKDTPQALVDRFFPDWARSADAQEIIQEIKNSNDPDDVDDRVLKIASVFLDEFLIPSLDAGKYPELLPWRPEDFGSFGRDADEFYENILESAANAADHYLGDKMYPTVDEYLKKNGYSSIDDWALDSDMYKVGDMWYDSNDNPINPEEYLAVLISEGIAE